MIAAIFGALSLFNTLSGSLLDVFFGYILALPVAWYTAEYGFKSSALMAVACVFVVWMTGLPSFIFIACQALATGIVIGWALRKKQGKGVMLGSATLVSFAFEMASVYVFAAVLGVDYTAEMTQMYQDMTAMMPTVMTHVSLNMMLSLIPASLFLMALLEAYVTILMCEIVFLRLKIVHVDFPANFHIATFRLGRRWGIVIALATFVSMIAFQRTAQVVWEYVFLFGAVALMVNGAAAFSWLCVATRHPKLAGLGFPAMIVPGLNIALVVLSLWDIVSDLRGKIMYNK